MSITSFGLIPIAIGIAITRHKLYDIDALISRALVVGALGVFVTALYVGIVVGVGASIGQRQPSVWLSVLATALVAVLFQPVRERVHRLSNRLVYGSRSTPYEVLSDFSVSMAGRYTTAELLPRMAQTVSECLGGARVEVWLRTGQEMAREVVWPDQAEDGDGPPERPDGRRGRAGAVRRPGGPRAPRRGAARPARGDQAAHRAGHPGRGRDARVRRLAGGAGAAQRAAGGRPAELARAAGHHAGRRTPPTRAQPARRRPAEPGVGGTAAPDGCRVRRSRLDSRPR